MNSCLHVKVTCFVARTIHLSTFFWLYNIATFTFDTYSQTRLTESPLLL